MTAFSKIIVHASSEATDALMASAASIRAMTQQIFTPTIGESISIGQHTKTFSVSLADALLASLKLSRVSDSIRYGWPQFTERRP